MPLAYGQPCARVQYFGNWCNTSEIEKAAFRREGISLPGELYGATILFLKTASSTVLVSWFSRGSLGECQGRGLGSPLHEESTEVSDSPPPKFEKRRNKRTSLKSKKTREELNKRKILSRGATEISPTTRKVRKEITGV